MESIMDILQGAIERHASDLFLIAGLPLTYKVGGRQQRVEQARLMPEDTARLVPVSYTHLDVYKRQLQDSGRDTFQSRF